MESLCEKITMHITLIKSFKAKSPGEISSDDFEKKNQGKYTVEFNPTHARRRSRVNSVLIVLWGLTL